MKAYGGFINGRLDWFDVNDEFGGKNIRKIPAIFKSKKAAESQYTDVRPINIIESIGHAYKIDRVSYKYRKVKEKVNG